MSILKEMFEIITDYLFPILLTIFLFINFKRMIPKLFVLLGNKRFASLLFLSFNLLFSLYNLIIFKYSLEGNSDKIMVYTWV